MSLSPIDIIQSFRLRFWWESQQGTAGDWRGDVWHEQQKLGEKAKSVANLEDAFDLVRHLLERSSETPAAEIRSPERNEVEASIRVAVDETPLRTLKLPRLLLSIWHRLRSAQP